MSILKTIKISTCQNQQPLSILTLSKLALSTLLPDPMKRPQKPLSEETSHLDQHSPKYVPHPNVLAKEMLTMSEAQYMMKLETLSQIQRSLLQKHTS